MAWNEQWSYLVDGVEVNNRTQFFCQIPELDNQVEQQIILANIDGDWPSYIRMQPVEGPYTFIINMRAVNWVSYRVRLNTLKSIFSYGEHVLQVQARGMVNYESVRIVVSGFTVDPKKKEVVVKSIAPKPVLE